MSVVVIVLVVAALVVGGIVASGRRARADEAATRTELESNVLALYLDGHSYEVIGEKLDCDTKTVDNALQRVKRKVGIHLASRAVKI